MDDRHGLRALRERSGGAQQRRHRACGSRALGALVLAGALLVLAAGCGGGGGGDGAQATPTATTPAPLTPREKRQREFRRYLAQSQAANGFYQRGRSEGNRTVDALDGATPGGSVATEGAKTFRQAAASVAEASVRQRIADPPKALRGINRRFAQDMGAVSDYWDTLAGSVSSVASYSAALNGSPNAGGPVRNEWRLQVTAYGRELGIPLPAWARQIGKTVP